MSCFCHLHRHGDHSPLDGTGTADQYAGRAAELGMPALALTDHGNLGGILSHVEACQKHGIAPLLGVEAYFRPDRFDVTETCHLILLAKSLEGWQNLMRMTTEAYASGFHQRPAVDWSILEKYHDGIVATTACMSSFLARRIRDDDEDRARTYLRRMRDLFGEDLYVEIQPNSVDIQHSLNPRLIALAQEYSIPLLTTCDVHYPFADWTDTQDVLLMCATGQNIADRKKRKDAGEDVFKGGEPTAYLMSEEEVWEAYATYHPEISENVIAESIANTHELAMRLGEIEISRAPKMPKVAKTAGEAEAMLREWCQQGLRSVATYAKDMEPYRQRMEYELEVIKGNDAIDYFVLVGTVVRWAREQGIRMGSGRGSAAGSLVSYLVGITGIDPIPHGLIFERFMNPGRKGMPDIDIDFESERVDEVKAFVAQRFGVDHVATVCAWQRFAPRSVLSDIGRVFNVPFPEVKKMTKLIDDLDRRPIDEIADSMPEVDRFRKAHPDVWKHARRLQGQVRTLGKHAAGVVITDRPITDYMPLMRTRKDDPLVTAWAEGGEVRISDFGFVKLDALSTTSLTIQQHALSFIPEDERPDLLNLPVVYDPDAADPEVMKIFSEGRTLGIFQFGSGGMRRLLKDMRADSFRDLVAANALFRPGPLQSGFADAYGRRKTGQEEVDYWHRSVEDVLDTTYGLMVYQEQVMLVCQRIGGFSLAEADDVRRAMGKKDVEKMKGYRTQFIEHAVSNDIMPRPSAEDLWERILTFAGYAFNIAHSAGYAVQGYQDAYLKTYHPREFFTAMASSDPEKIPAIMREARGLTEFLLPDINLSEPGFSIQAGGVMVGLTAIKGVGPAALTEVLKHRPYWSLDDMLAKVTKRLVNKRVIEALTESGALDRFGARDELSPEVKGQLEKERLSLSLSWDPVSMYVGRLDPYIDLDWESIVDGDDVQVGGEIVNVKQITTKKGDPMGFVEVTWDDNQWSLTLFPGTWAGCQSHLVPGNVVLARGKKDSDRDCVIADLVESASNVIRGA